MIDLTNACVAHYKLNDNAASTTVIDSMGNYNGTAQQNTEDLATTGKINGALVFTNPSDYVDANHTFESVFQSNFTINAWFRPDALPVGMNYVGVLTELGSGATEGDVTIRIHGPGDAPRDGLTMVYAITGGSLYVSTYNDVLNGEEGNWHMFTMRVREFGETVELTSYLDGVLINTDTSDVFNGMNNYISTENFILGEDGYSMNGAIDNVMIFNKALSQSEIDFLYNNGNGTEDLAEGRPLMDLIEQIWGF